ncbi:MAG: hypothetical protein AAFQ08_03410 [Bacteroidota bacterium]
MQKLRSDTIESIAKLLKAAAKDQHIKQCEEHLQAFLCAIRPSEISRAIYLLKGFKKAFKRLRTTNPNHKRQVQGLKNKVEYHQGALRYVKQVLEDREATSSRQLFLCCAHREAPLEEIDFAKLKKCVHKYRALSPAITCKVLNRLKGVLRNRCCSIVIDNLAVSSFLQATLQACPKNTAEVLAIVKQTVGAVRDQPLSARLVKLLVSIAASDVSYVGEVLDTLNLCYSNKSIDVRVAATHACLNILAHHPAQAYKGKVDVHQLHVGIESTRQVLQAPDTDVLVRQLVRNILEAYEAQKDDLMRYGLSRRTDALHLYAQGEERKCVRGIGP